MLRSKYYRYDLFSKKSNGKFIVDLVLIIFISTSWKLTTMIWFDLVPPKESDIKITGRSIAYHGDTINLDCKAGPSYPRNYLSLLTSSQYHYKLLNLDITLKWLDSNDNVLSSTSNNKFSYIPNSGDPRIVTESSLKVQVHNNSGRIQSSCPWFGPNTGSL